LPDILFRSQKQLGLKPLDILIILHLASYWWKADKNPWPSKTTIADYIDVDPRTVQRAIQKMEKRGYVQRIARKANAGDNLTNEYNLDGLVKALQPLAAAKSALKALRATEDKNRQVTPKAFALELVAGGKGK
jgi:DNA-binding transcriptional MocR family regulator